MCCSHATVHWFNQQLSAAYMLYAMSVHVTCNIKKICIYHGMEIRIAVPTKVFRGVVLIGKRLDVLNHLFL